MSKSAWEMEEPEEKARLDRMFGKDQWICHIDCPAALDAGQPFAFHHKDYHGKRDK